MDELEKCKKERKLLLITLMVLILIYFSFPIVKVFQPKKIVIENAEGERYRFNIPSDWVYWHTDNSNYEFINIWDKEDFMMVTFYYRKNNVLERFKAMYERENAFIIKRRINSLDFWEFKVNPVFSDDSGEGFYVKQLNCFIFYSGKLLKKEKRIRKFLSNWEKMGVPGKD